jgi:anti-sigma B factor antagonist
MIKIITKELKRVDVVKVAGRVDSNTAPQLENALNKIINAGRFHIVVNLSETDYMSSAALRALLSGLKQVRRWNRGDLRLTNMPDKIKKAFELAGFLELFQVFDDEVEAVGSF